MIRVGLTSVLPHVDRQRALQLCHVITFWARIDNPSKVEVGVRLQALSRCSEEVALVACKRPSIVDGYMILPRFSIRALVIADMARKWLLPSMLRSDVPLQGHSLDRFEAAVLGGIGY